MYNLGISSNFLNQTKIESSKVQQTSDCDFKDYVSKLFNESNLINTVSGNEAKGLPYLLKEKDILPALNKKDDLFEDLEDIKKIIERLCRDEKGKS